MIDVRFSLSAVGMMSLSVIMVLSGCGGDPGPEKYTVTGAVLCDGQTVNSGDIFFEPTDSLSNNQTAARAIIKDGRYTVEIVGGTHKISLRDFTGNIDFDPEGARSGKRPLVRVEYHGEVEYPPLSDVKDASDPVEKDIEIPARFCRRQPS